MNNKPIGIFDSGMGGLTVRAEIARALPDESLIYFGDGANVPYGGRTQDEITRFASEAVGRLVERGVKMVVVACNAATGAAIDHLRATFDIPIIGMEPAVKPAALTTETGVVGVLATAAALKGELYRRTAARFREKIRIIEAVGEGFVELVENDLETTPEALETVRRAVLPMLEAGADRIVLGCTHYPFLGAQIGQVIDEWKGLYKGSELPDNKIIVIDSGAAIARRVHQVLTEMDMLASPRTEENSGNSCDNDHTRSPKHEFISFAGEDYAARLARKTLPMQNEIA